MNEIEINGVKYVPKDSVKQLCLTDKVLVRCESAGVFFGKLESLDESTAVAVISNARRIWYWDGASSLSQLALDGTSKPNNCKFPAPITEIKVFKVIEVLKCTEAAAKSIASVPVWKQ